mgnify:CR=1 FL=1
MEIVMTHKLAARFTTQVATLKDRERGQGAVEYIGMLLVVAVIIAAVVAAFDAFEWDAKVKELINKVLGG